MPEHPPAAMEIHHLLKTALIAIVLDGIDLMEWLSE